MTSSRHRPSRLVAATIGIAIPIFLFLWIFQMVRELGYWIEHGKAAMVVDGRPVEGRLRVFSGVPRELPDRVTETGFDSTKDCFVVLDMGLRHRLGYETYDAVFAVETILPSHLRQDKDSDKRRSALASVTAKPQRQAMSRESIELHASHPDGVVHEYSLASKASNGSRKLQIEGWRPGERIVTFVFSGALRDEADWVRAGLVPDLLIVHWADWPGYLRASLSVELFVEAVLMAAFLVWHFLLLRDQGREIFVPTNLHPISAKARNWLLGIAVSGIVLYQLPLFHNIVFLWFGAWSLVAVFAWKSLLEPSKPRASVPKRQILALLVVVVLGMIPRLAHLDWGAPLLLHPDEYAFTDFPPRMAETNSLNPGDFERPNHPSIYTNSMVYGVAARLVYGQPIQQVFAEHPFFFHLISRWIVALWGGVGIFAAWLVGRRFHPLAGFWSAVLMAVQPAFLEHAHYATPDVPMTAMQLFSIWLSLRFFESRSWRDLAPAILWVSLASGEKYPGILYLVAPIFVLVWSHRENWTGWRNLSRDLVRLEIVYIVGLFVFAPFVFLDAHLVLLNLISESRPTHLGQDGFSWIGNLLFYARTYLGQASVGLLVLALLGGVLAVRKFGVRSVPLLSGLFYWVLVSRLPLHWERWSLPMTVTPLVLSAIGLAWIQLRAGTASGAWKAMLVPVLGVSAIVIGGQVFLSEMAMSRLGATDTRVAGLAPLRAMGIVDSNSVVSQYTTMAPAWKPGFDFVSAATDSVGMLGRRYAIVSNSMYDRFLAEPARYRRETDFYRNLFKRKELLRLEPSSFPWGVSPNDWDLASKVVPFWNWWMSHQGKVYVGPTIRVFDLSATLGDDRQSLGAPGVDASGDIARVLEAHVLHGLERQSTAVPGAAIQDDLGIARKRGKLGLEVRGVEVDFRRAGEMPGGELLRGADVDQAEGGLAVLGADQAVGGDGGDVLGAWPRGAGSEHDAESDDGQTKHDGSFAMVVCRIRCSRS